jgi:periplasmic protein TonB
MNSHTDEPNGNVATLESAPPKLAPMAKMPKPAPPPTTDDSFWEDEEVKGWRKYRPMIIVAVLSVGGFIAAQRMLSKGAEGPVAQQEVQTFKILAAPPPPPPPPPPPEAPKETAMVKEIEEEPEDSDPTPAIATALKGPAGGPNMGLKTGSTGSSFAQRSAISAERLKWKNYSAQAANRIESALRMHPRTKTARLSMEVRVWPDSTGRITRVTLGGSTGDSALDAAIRDEVLTNLQLSQPPPEGMPTPIILRVTGKRPN